MALASIITSIAGGIVKPIADIVSKHVADKDLAAKLTADLQKGAQDYLTTQLTTARDVIVAEAQGGSWIQRSWRPITMLTFVALIVARWLGFTAPGITEQTELALLDIVKIGLGGYVLGRSAEKVAKVWKDKP